jgi:hypothetical protein
MNEILMKPQDSSYNRNELDGIHSTFPARNLGLPKIILGYHGLEIDHSPTHKFIGLPLDGVFWSASVIEYYE